MNWPTKPRDGELRDNKKRKLGRAAVLLIRMTKKGPNYIKKLAAYHGVSRATVLRIRRREHYKEVK